MARYLGGKRRGKLRETVGGVDGERLWKGWGRWRETGEGQMAGDSGKGRVDGGR